MRRPVLAANTLMPSPHAAQTFPRSSQRMPSGIPTATFANIRGEESNPVTSKVNQEQSRLTVAFFPLLTVIKHVKHHHVMCSVFVKGRTPQSATICHVEQCFVWRETQPIGPVQICRHSFNFRAGFGVRTGLHSKDVVSLLQRFFAIRSHVSPSAQSVVWIRESDGDVRAALCVCVRARARANARTRRHCQLLSASQTLACTETV